MATLSVDSAGYASELVRLRRVKHVASYSWIDAPVPTIAVPGTSTHTSLPIPYIYQSQKALLGSGQTIAVQ